VALGGIHLFFWLFSSVDSMLHIYKVRLQFFCLTVHARATHHYLFDDLDMPIDAVPACLTFVSHPPTQLTCRIRVLLTLLRIDLTAPPGTL